MEANDTQSQLECLKVDIHNIKDEMKQVLLNCHVEFEVSYEQTTNLVQIVSKYQDAVEQCKSKINTEVLPNMQKDLSRAQQLNSQVRDLEMVYETLKLLLKLHQSLKSLETALSSDGQDSLIAELVENLDTDFRQPLQLAKDDLDVYEALREKFTVHKNSALVRLMELWKECVEFKDLESQFELSLAGVNKVRIAARSLDVIRALGKPVNKFCESLCKKILLPLISDGHATWKKSHSRQTGLVITILQSTDSDNSEPPSPETMFATVTDVLKLMYDQLFHIVLPDNETLAERARSQIGSWLIETIIKQCMSKTVPKTAEQLEAYKPVKQASEIFCSQLSEWKMIDKNDALLLSDYIKDIGKVYLEQKTASLMSDTRELARKSLFQSQNVSELNQSLEKDPVLPPVVFGETAEAVATYLQNDLLLWPSCEVCNGAQKLVYLLRDALLEAADGDDVLKKLVCRTVRHILEVWPGWAMTFHGDDLSQLPQAAALLHNSLMFLAHRCVALGALMRKCGAPGLSDLIPELRRVASSVFLEQLRTQRELIEDILSGANQLRGRPGDDASRAVRGVILHLKKLADVWQVLPGKLWNKALGALVSAFTGHLADWTLAREDTGSEEGDSIHQIFSTVRDESVEIFCSGAHPLATVHDQVDVLLPTVATNWSRFVQVMFLLRASLADISEKWANGKGPLAIALTGSEVKSAVRALFQNTEHRAALLARIR